MSRHRSSKASLVPSGLVSRPQFVEDFAQGVVDGDLVVFAQFVSAVGAVELFRLERPLQALLKATMWVRETMETIEKGDVQSMGVALPFAKQAGLSSPFPLSCVRCTPTRFTSQPPPPDATCFRFDQGLEMRT